MLEKVWGKGNPPSLGGNVNRYNHYGEEHGGFLKKTKNRTTVSPCNPTPGHTSGENQNSKRYAHLSAHHSSVHGSQDVKPRHCL